MFACIQHTGHVSHKILDSKLKSRKSSLKKGQWLLQIGFCKIYYQKDLCPVKMHLISGNCHFQFPMIIAYKQWKIKGNLRVY